MTASIEVEIADGHRLKTHIYKTQSIYTFHMVFDVLHNYIQYASRINVALSRKTTKFHIINVTRVKSVDSNVMLTM